MKIRLKECANVVDLSFNKTYDVEKSNDQSFMVIDDVKERNWIDKEDCKIVQSSVVEETKEWSGEGTPKVGQYLQVYVKSNIIESWAKAKVLAVDHNVIVVRYKYPDKGYKYSGFDIKDVRPIKSEKDKEIEILRGFVCEAYINNGNDYVGFAEQLYDRGVRVKVEDSQ